MKKSNSIVRTKTTHGNTNEKHKMHYSIEFMTFENYLSRDRYIHAGAEFKLHPYKWYDLRYLYQKPSHYLLSLLSKVFKKDLILNKTNKIAAYLTILIIESLSSWVIVELVKSII